MPAVFLGNGIDYAAKRSAVFGFEAARLDLNFLNEVGLEVLADAAVLNIRRVNAIDEVNVLGVAGAVDLVAANAAFSCALQWFLPSARSKRDYRLERAQFGNVHQNFLGDVGLDFALRNINYRRLGRDVHLLRDSANLHR